MILGLKWYLNPLTLKDYGADGGAGAPQRDLSLK